MGRRFGGIALLVLAGFMVLGFLRTGASLASPTAFVAVLLTAVLPAVVGYNLLRGTRASRERMDQLREQTIESELQRLAVQHQGRLTVAEVVAALALPAAQAQERLDALVRREVADIDFTEDGVVYYTFHDARHLKGSPAGEPRRLRDG
jgi:outer membrane murein-binding lipoprotein Lpp